jgi:uncharacterized protein
MQSTRNSDQLTSVKSIPWIEIIIFYVIAVLVSAPFRIGLIHMDKVLPLPYGLDIFYHIFRGIGPAVGFCVVYYLLKSNVPKTMSFWGIKKIYSFLAIVIIPIGLTIAGVSNSTGLNQHYYGFLTGIMLVLYAIGEEYGWRGYLQQALSPIKLSYRIVIIALFWYFWHLNFLLPDFTIQTHFLFFGFLLLGSWGLLKISESTGSILFVVAVHLSFNVLSDVHADLTRKLVIIGVAVIVWIILIKSLQKDKKGIREGVVE